MPQTKTQGAVFGLLMSYFMALGMEVANVAHKLGAMSNAVFLPALKETAFMGAIVFVVSMLYGSRAGQHIAHRFVQPGRDNPLLVTLAVSGCTVMVMCPSMSLIATALFTGIFLALPDKRQRFVHVLPGAAGAACAWVIFSELYSWYVNHIDRASALYGSLSVLLLMLLWLYACLSILFYGALLNHLLFDRPEPEERCACSDT